MQKMNQVHADTVDTHPWAGSRGISAGLGECARLAPSCAGLEGLPRRGKLSTDVKERGLLGQEARRSKKLHGFWL